MTSAHRPSAELIDRLAADYVLGTMKGGARRRFEGALQTELRLAQAVMQWQQRLLPLHAGAQPLPAGDALWARIEQQAFGAPKAAPRPRGLRWWQRLLAPLPAGALALGVLLGSVAPPLWQQLAGGSVDAQLPESYVGVLATAGGKPGLIVSSLRRGRVVDFKRLVPVAVPTGQTLFLWSLDAQGVAQPIAALPGGGAGNFFSLRLSQPAETLFQRAVELAVSIEPAGAAPAQPGNVFVYRGLCGKLWPMPMPMPASAPGH
ncbi:MAG: anti-sigma factor [Rubrivivax sp.]|nr:anti-sigma factor [Rubrivivax sp.]MBK8528804.1 anti-sigma factor [Rubrivivax sp.]